MSVQEWISFQPKFNYQKLQLIPLINFKRPSNINLNDLIKKSAEFPLVFPTENVRCKQLTIKNEILQKNINSACVLVHENILHLCLDFLIFKTQFGTDPEKTLYSNMNLLDFLQRLIEKRAVYFVGKNDQFLLMDQTESFGNWELIGTDFETKLLNLKKCLSYDELKLSSFLSISSYSYFINDGNIDNLGLIRPDLVQSEGVLIGCCFLRLEKPEKMEYQEIIITQEQNNCSNQKIPSVRKLFMDFYQEKLWTYEEVQRENLLNSERFLEVFQEIFIDKTICCKKLSLSIDTILLEANARAQEIDRFAYIHILDLGIENWKISLVIQQIFIDSLIQRIQFLGVIISNISDINIFSFKTSEEQKINFVSIPNHPKHGIKLVTDKRNPFTQLPKEHEGKLLVVVYPGNANAFPGNEFWKGEFSSSSAAVCCSCSQISELQNAHINPKICAENIKVITGSDLISIEKFQEEIHEKYYKAK